MSTSHLTPEQTLRRLEHRLNELSAFEDRRVQPLAGATFQAPGALPVPLELGQPWPQVTEGAVFRWTVPPPEERPGLLRLNVGGEALLKVNGQRVYGLNPYHREYALPDDVSFPLEIEVEASPHDLFGSPSPDLRLLEAALVWPDELVRGLWAELDFAHQAVRALLKQDRRDAAERVLARLEGLVDALDVPRSPSEAYLSRLTQSRGAGKGSTFAAERFAVWERWQFAAEAVQLTPGQRANLAALREELHAQMRAELEFTPSEGRLFLNGHAHIDLAWLWPVRETRRKIQRTFAGVLSLMERDPEFYFNQSSAQAYAWIEQDAPKLFAQIVRRVQEGRWNIIGGMWVEPDGNLPGGESWARQLLYGQRYFQEKFGLRARVAWLPDTFGYAANLPQLFQQAGLEYFGTTKLIWNETTVFPHHLYRWEALDGTQVTAHIFNNPQHNYNGQVIPEQLLDTWRAFKGKKHHPESLFTFGFGDGGGGPTPEMLANLRAFPEFPGLPRLRTGHIDDFFGSLPQEGTQNGLPVWVGEQYFEFHRGTYTSQARVKRLHRQAEVALGEAETATTLAHLSAGFRDARAELEGCWKNFLLHQFHDILPGSSIHTVNVEAEAALKDVLDAARGLRDEALRALSERVGRGRRQVVWNLDLHARTHADGQTVPPLGCRVLGSPPESGSLNAAATHLENDFLRAEFAPDGTLGSLIHRPSGQEFLSGPANVLRVHPDIPRNWEAWDVDAADLGGGEALRATSAPELKVTAEAAELTYQYEWQGSTIWQTYRLGRHSSRLDIHTRIHWTGRRTMLRASVPTNLRASHARFETAYGVVERATHDNLPADAAQFEVPALRFADLSESTRGLSLLNNGKHGHRVKHGELNLNLLRSPIYPDPYADEGEHEFTYSLFPHADPSLAQTFAQAHDLNSPLIVVEAGQDGADVPEQSWLGVTSPHVQFSALKLAEDGHGLILRVAQSTGTRTPLEFAGELAQGWQTVTLLEEPLDAPPADLRAFEVRTLRRGSR